MVDRDAESRLESAIQKHVLGGNVVAFKKRNAAQPRPSPGIYGARVSISGTSNTVVLGSHNTVTVHAHHEHARNAATEAGDDDLSEAETAALQQLVLDLHERTAQPLRQIWVALHDFQRAESFLLKQFGPEGQHDGGD